MSPGKNPRFPTNILYAAIERQQKEQEAFRVQIIDKLFSILDTLVHELPFEEAYLFGSVTKPHRFSIGSDIDIGFVGLKNEYFFKAMSFISREIGIDVDVVQLEGHRLAEKIKREGIKWTRKD